MPVKIAKIKDKRVQIQIPPNSRCEINTSDNMFKHHINMLCCGKRNSGKSILITNYLRMMQDENCLDRLFVISPTIESNKALIDSLNVKPEDIYDPDERGVVELLLEAIDLERDRYVGELEKIKRYTQFQKLLKSDIPVGCIDADLLIEFSDYLDNSSLEPPQLKYGHRPFLHCFVDDCQSTALFRDKMFHHLAIRSRHVGIMPYKKNDPEMCGALGISIYIAIQNFTAGNSGSCPRCVRNNVTQMAICGTSKDEAELMNIYKSVAGEIPYDKFMAAYEYATKETYGSLIIDLNPKKTALSKFRKDFNEYIILD